MASKILFCPKQPPVIMDMVRQLTPPGFELVPADIDTPEFYEAAAQAEYYLGFARRMGNDFFRAAPNLKLVQLTSAGYDQVDPEAAKKAKVPVSNNGGANAIAVAEHAIMLMLACAKQAVVVDQRTRKADWGKARWEGMLEMNGKTLGIIGVGNIGRRVARTAAALGMRVIGYDKYVPADEVRNRGVEPMPDMASVLRQADVVTCHTPHTKESHHMIDAAAVAQMKDGVIFVNTSRGKTQDETALVAGLESGKIRAAGIDVFEEEPASSDNRFFQLENVIVSPHIAGVTRETMRGMALQVTAEMLRVLRGEKPHVLANADLWPRLGHLK
jgi:phosphoglycerate dehydrogenase-like enzyme